MPLSQPCTLGVPCEAPCSHSDCDSCLQDAECFWCAATSRCASQNVSSTCTSANLYTCTPPLIPLSVVSPVNGSTHSTNSALTISWKGGAPNVSLSFTW